MTASSSHPIKVLSPSRFEVLRLCHLRVAAAQGAPPPMRQDSAILGDLVHAVFEGMVRSRAMWGAPDSVDDAFSQAWSAQVEDRTNSGVDIAGFADYRRAKLRAQRRAIAIADYLRPHDPSVVSVEEDLVSPDGLLRGRADLVVRSRGGTEIVDFKTGGRIRPSMLERFERQLLFYAGLEMERSGSMPVVGRVLSTSSDWYTVEIDRRRCQWVLSEARRNLIEFDSVAPGPQPATPRPDACRFCGHAAACQDFWSSVTPDWLVTDSGTATHAVSGRLLEISAPAANGRVSLRLAPIRATVPTDGDVEVVGLGRGVLGEPAKVVPDAMVSLVGLRLLNSSTGRTLSGRVQGLRVHVG